MFHIEKTVTTSALVVSKLEERSKEISQIVDALNAVIEAARAGEQSVQME